MTYFPAKREYHEKYQAQKILQNARDVPIEHFQAVPSGHLPGFDFEVYPLLFL